MTITPEAINDQARKQYKNFLTSVITRAAFFPLEVRFGKIQAKDTLRNFAQIQQALACLQQHSKEKIGYGYAIDFIERNDQKIGRQKFPDRIYFSGPEDYLKYIHKVKEFQEFVKNLELILSAIPQLQVWVVENPFKIIENEKRWGDLLKVCRYFVANPRPALYIRELPIEIPTKFVEENKGILRSLLDFLLGDAVARDETDFEKRFYLKYAQPLVRLKVLDPAIARGFFNGLTDISLPLDELAGLDTPCRRVIILENKTNFSNIYNLLTLPDLKDTLALFGKGFGIGLLKDIPWLQKVHIYYWGDIDVEGFRILAMLRSYYPGTESLMMDRETFERFREYAVDNPNAYAEVVALDNLTGEERELYGYLYTVKTSNRLEQEKISHAYVVERLRTNLRYNIK
jgi:hypothetical protein